MDEESRQHSDLTDGIFTFSSLCYKTKPKITALTPARSLTFPATKKTYMHGSI